MSAGLGGSAREKQAATAAAARASRRVRDRRRTRSRFRPVRSSKCSTPPASPLRRRARHSTAWSSAGSSRGSVAGARSSSHPPRRHRRAARGDRARARSPSLPCAAGRVDVRHVLAARGSAQSPQPAPFDAHLGGLRPAAGRALGGAGRDRPDVRRSKRCGATCRPGAILAFHGRELAGFPDGRQLREPHGTSMRSVPSTSHSSAPGAARRRRSPSALVTRTMLVADWLALLRADPRLPRELLDDDWPADRSLALYRELRARTAEPAAEEYRRARRAPRTRADRGILNRTRNGCRRRAAHIRAQPASSSGGGLPVPRSCRVAVGVPAAGSVHAQEARRRLGVAAWCTARSPGRRTGGGSASATSQPGSSVFAAIHRSRRARERCPARPTRSARTAPGAGRSPGRPTHAPCPGSRSTGRIRRPLPL